MSLGDIFKSVGKGAMERLKDVQAKREKAEYEAMGWDDEKLIRRYKMASDRATKQGYANELKRRGYGH